MELVAIPGAPPDTLGIVTASNDAIQLWSLTAAGLTVAQRIAMPDRGAETVRFSVVAAPLLHCIAAVTVKRLVFELCSTWKVWAFCRHLGLFRSLCSQDVQ